VERLVLLELLAKLSTMAIKGKSHIANPIAERRFAVVGEPEREIVITIGKPRPESDPSVWMCSYLVEGIPKARRRIARGVDSLQALQMAIEGARYTLSASGLVCIWHDSEPGEIGLPRSVPSFEGSDFAEKIERYIDRELKKFARVAKASRSARGPRRQ
jgi:hypothetical protein